MHTKHAQAGFVVSVELMLIGLILALGLITGWVKFRDESLSEIKDSMAAIDAYILGSGPVWQLGGTRWISGGTVVAPAATGPVTEGWGNDPDPANWTISFPAARETAPGSHVYVSRDGLLTYGTSLGE